MRTALKTVTAILVVAGIALSAGCVHHPRYHSYRYYHHHDNPQGPVGGPGTNWANPPGRRGGPGASPYRRWRW